MKFLKSLLLIAPIVVDFYGGIPSFGILADAATHEGNNRLLYEGMAGTDPEARGLKGEVPFANLEVAISATNGMRGSATLRGRNKHRHQLGEGRAGTEAKEHGLKGGVPFANLAGVIRGTFKTSAIAILSSSHLVAFANSAGVRGDVVPRRGGGKAISVPKAEGKGIDSRTKRSLSMANIFPAKENPVASLGDTFTKTDLAADEGLNDKMNRHLEGTCLNQAFVNGTELKVAVDAYINDQDCATDSELCEFGVTYGWPINSWCVGAVTRFDQLFSWKHTFNQDISSWQTSQVTDMTYMFQAASAFNQDISGWGVARVTGMQSMFNGASTFNQDINSWDVARVTEMQYMFGGASTFNQDISGWDVSKVTSMIYMFGGASAFDQDISGWDVSKVMKMQMMFYAASAFNQNIGGWDVSMVDDMFYMLNAASAFNQELCAWGQYYKSSSNYYNMFGGTDCLNTGTPASANGPWCLETSHDQCYLSGPWEIHFQNLSADFSVDSSKEIILDYEVGKDQQYESLLFMKDCVSNVTDITVNYTEPVLTPKNATFKTLSLDYSIDKSMIVNSTIWNATSNQIELCQIVQLKEGAMVIVEDIRQVTIDFDLLVDYDINNSTLGAATTNAGNDTANVASYIEACKCEGVSFACNTDALVSSKDLIVCINSVSPDVRIDFLDSLIVSQEESSSLAFIEDNVAVFPTFTSREYVTTENGVVVFTRVPINLFDYNSPQSSITITGKIALKLAGSGRKLKADIGPKFDASEEASFAIEVNLQRETMLEDETSMNFAASVVSSNSVIAPAMVLAWTYVMW